MVIPGDFLRCGDCGNAGGDITILGIIGQATTGKGNGGSAGRGNAGKGYDRVSGMS